MTNHSSPASTSHSVSLDQVFNLFTHLLDLQSFVPWPLPGGRRRFYDRIWSPLVVLWYVLWQRLQTDATLDAVVQDARRGGADALSRGRRPLSQRLRSHATTAFSNARRRLPLRWLRQGFQQWTTRLRDQAPGLLWHGLNVALLDGSTVRLRPHGNLPQRFGRAANQHGQNYWCLMRVVVAFCARSGLALATGLGAMSVSEQALAVTLILRALPQRVWVGDRNFGLWRIARAALQAHGHVLVRLTEGRARRLAGVPLEAGQDMAVCWTPSPHDQVDPGLERQPVPGRLLGCLVRRAGFRDQWLYLFTTLTDVTGYPAEQLLALYAIRWHAELNLRSLKAQMRLGQLEVKSARLVIQQWYAGLLAYNLIRGVMLWAGAARGSDPQPLSFAQARRRVIAAVREWQRSQDPGPRRPLWAQLLAEVAATLVPRRRQPRPAEPRAKYHVRETFPPLRGSRAAARALLREPPTKC